MPTDSYYNPLEAIVSGDYKYIFGKRNNTTIPSWLKNRWISAEFIYNINSSQRLSIMYGSIMGGLFCSNGICRIIPAFNEENSLPHLEKNLKNFEKIILIDNYSTDNTYELAKSYGWNV